MEVRKEGRNREEEKAKNEDEMKAGKGRKEYSKKEGMKVGEIGRKESKNKGKETRQEKKRKTCSPGKLSFTTFLPLCILRKLSRS